MNKKIIAYILIGLGALDIIIWILNGFTFGWLELVVGVNVISMYGGWGMIALGIWYYQKEKAIEKSEIDDIADLESGEEIVFKNVGNATIVTVTNKKIIYRAHNVEEATLNFNDNVVAEDKATFPYSEIDSITSIKFKDIATTKFGKLKGINFGISLKMKDGSVKHLPTSKSELLCAHISKYIN